MSAQDQQLGKTLWNIADKLRGAMNADDFRDYMLAFLLCLRYLTDDLIAAQSDKLETLKTHKKGLMQQLFPMPEELAS